MSEHQHRWEKCVCGAFRERDDAWLDQVHPSREADRIGGGATGADPGRETDLSTILAWADDYLAINHEPCRFDHNGYCQEHGYGADDVIAGRCPERRAQEAAQRLAGVEEDR